jgi:hypothetical protein
MVWMLLVFTALTACADRKLKPLRSPPSTTDSPESERTALAASFVGRNLGALERLLHDSVIVQPPPPDTARQGADAISYLMGLAENTLVKESWLNPTAIVPEGPFLFEQGVWTMRAGDRRLRGSYILRWRRTPERWKVVLWRWSLFR